MKIKVQKWNSDETAMVSRSSLHDALDLTLDHPTCSAKLQTDMFEHAIKVTEKEDAMWRRTRERHEAEEAREKEARRNRIARESEEFNREMDRRRARNQRMQEFFDSPSREEKLDGLKARETAPVPEGYVVLPLKAITKEGDMYFSTLRRKWVCLSNSVGRRVENCDRGRILRKNPFLEAGTPESITKTSFAKVTPKDMCERIPCVVRLFTEPAYGFKDTRHVSFDVVNRQHEEDFHGDFLLPNRVSVFELTDLALKYSSVSPRGLKRFLARWIEVESSK